MSLQVRSLDQTPDLRNTAMETLCALVMQLGRKYRIFVPLVSRVISRHRINCPRYELLTTKILTVSLIFLCGTIMYSLN